MRTRLLFLILFILIVSGKDASADVIQRIEEWNGLITAVTGEDVSKSLEGCQWSRKWHYLDMDQMRFKPLIIKEGYETIALAQNNNSFFAICCKDGRLFFFRKSRFGNAQWNIRPLRIRPDRKPGLWLAAGDNLLFVITNKEVWCSRDTKRWSRSSLGTILKVDWNIEPWLVPLWETLPKAVLATTDMLFLGFDIGEWWGAAYGIPLTQKGIGGPGRRIADKNVRDISKDRQGDIWIAGGLTHMRGKSATLYRYRQGKTDIIISQYAVDGKITEKSGLLAGYLSSATDFQAMTLNGIGNPVILARHLGIFEVADEKLVPIIASTDPQMEQYLRIVGERYPVGMVIKDGSIFIAGGSLLVFEFEKTGEHFEFRRIPFSLE